MAWNYKQFVVISYGFYTQMQRHLELSEQSQKGTVF